MSAEDPPEEPADTSARPVAGPTTMSQRIGDWAGRQAELDLESSLADLSALLVDRQPLEDTLRQVADFTVAAIPGADGTGVTLLENRRPANVVASAEFVRSLDVAQYSLREGPCVAALDSGQTQVIRSTQSDQRWPRFAARAIEHRVLSVLSLPLQVRGVTRGALNVYSRTEGSFDVSAVRIGELFAGPAAVTAATAQVLADSRQLAEHLGEALRSRAVIDQAKGILMAVHGCDADRAFALLREASQNSHRKLRDVAHDMIAAIGHRGPDRPSAPDADHPASAADGR
jgi:transcriptional regulator with GAF, ATPase, and Fis domain